MSLEMDPPAPSLVGLCIIGALVTGVDAFVEIWKVLPGFSALAKVASLPGIHLGLRVGYRGFAAIRPLLPKRKKECEDGRCTV